MMRVWDAELLSKRRIQPVQDGLLLWLDGQDGIEGVELNNRVYHGAIKDRVSGELATFDHAYQSEFLESDGMMFKFTTTSSYEVAMNVEFDAYSTMNIKTVEAVVQMSAPVRAKYANIANIGKSGQDYAIVNGSNAALWHAACDNSRPTHLLATIESGLLNVYKDGVRVSSMATSLTAFPVMPSLICMYLYKGASYTPESKWCYIGSLRLYDRALSQVEVTKNFNFEQSIGRMTL